MDLVTLQRKDVQSKLFKTSSTFIGDCVWSNFIEIMDQMLVLVEVLSQGFFLGNFFKEQENGWLLAAVCIMPQIVRGLMYTDEFGGGRTILSFIINIVDIIHSMVRLCSQ